MKNRFAGECRGCGEFVAKNQGCYEAGLLLCSDAVELHYTPYSLGLMNGCAPTAKRDSLFPHKSVVCLSSFNQVLGTTFATAAEVVSAHFAEHEATKPTAEQVAAVKAQMRASEAAERKQRRAELADYKARNICTRCHGAGGSDAWFATGWTCNRCHGTGKYS
jgi:hypothetical protein